MVLKHHITKLPPTSIKSYCRSGFDVHIYIDLWNYKCKLVQISLKKKLTWLLNNAKFKCQIYFKHILKTLLYEFNDSLSELILDGEAYTAVHLLNLW